jgi:signal transduction histidine kinase
VAQVVARAGAELAEAAGAAFSITTQGTPRPLAAGRRDQIYRIAREALLNASQHARPATIEVEIAYETDRFVLRVRDDGAGIPADVLAAGSRPGHYGLAGMRERAQRLGGQAAVWSRAGAGTEVELSVPAAAAYPAPATTTRRAWLAGWSWRRPGRAPDGAAS